MIRKSAVAAVAAGLAIAGSAIAAPSAFAANPPAGTPSGGLAVTVVVPSTLSISLDENSATLTAAPGSTVSTSPEPIATILSNDTNGYSLLAQVTTPFTDSLSQSIPDTAFQIYEWAGNNQAQGGRYVAFDAAGDALPVFTTTSPSGFITSVNGQLSSPGNGSDVITAPLQLTVPGNQPTSNSGYNGALTYYGLGT